MLFYRIGHVGAQTAGPFLVFNIRNWMPDMIRCFTHFTTKRINFSGEMSFCQAADGWIARHLADGVGINC